MKNLPKVIFCSDKSKAEYKQAVLRDGELQALKLIVINRWPPDEKSCSFARRKYARNAVDGFKLHYSAVQRRNPGTE